MTRPRIIACGLVVLALLAVLSETASAIPAFARKYGFNCSMCHSNFPRLNDFGTRYRNNGYQLPGREQEDRTVLESPPPFAMRASGGYTSDAFSNIPEATDASQFLLNGFDILSGGLLYRNIGYFLVYPPEIKPSRGLEGQEGTLEMASVIFSNLGSPWLNVRAGRFEAAYVTSSAKRSLSFSPYEIYDFACPGGLAYSETQDGIELTGAGKGFSYAAGIVDGAPSNLSDDGPSDLYFRAAKVFGHGEGQTAGQRIGVTGYFGKARPGEGLPEGDRQSFHRLGIDASLNASHVNLTAQYLQGKDDRGLWGLEDDADVSGGFAELSFLPLTRLVSFARYDMVDAPEVLFGDITRWTGGVRFYFVDNLALHLEYSRREQDLETGAQAKEDFFTFRLDFAF